MRSAKEIKDHFAAGAESVTLTRAEWEFIWEVSRQYFANKMQVKKAEEETERVKRIARPLWRACKSVARQIRNCAGSPSLWHLREWEMRLRHATQVDWHDLPPQRRGQPPRYR